MERINQEEDLDGLKVKFSKLEGLIGRKLKEGMVIDAKDIGNRYQQVEGQMREYLNQMRLEHAHKLQTIRDL